MQEDTININGQFGKEKKDIKNVYILAKTSGAFDTIYITYNNGDIKKVIKPTNISYKEFASNINKFLKKIGATNDNKNSRWFIATKNNNWGINFNYLENSYQNMKMSDNMISFKVDETNINIKKSRFKLLKVDRLEDLERLEDDYAIYKVKLIRNILAAAIFSIITFPSINDPGSYVNLRSNLIYIVDFLLILSSVVDGIVLNENKKMRKKLESNV